MSCYLCQSDTPRPFLRVRERSLLHCESCGLIYVEERRNGGGISADQGKFLREYLREEGSFARYFHEKLAMIERLRPAGTVLDFGCGAGTFLRCARERGWQVTGVEGSGPAAAHARSTGLNIQEGVIEDLRVSGSFDVVTTFQTLEHFADPVAFLRAAKSLLNPGGLLVVTTPDRNSLMGKLLGKRWFGYYNDEHVFFYDTASLKATLEKAGFSDTRVIRENGRALSPPWVYIRLFDYYYRHPGPILGLVMKTKPVWEWFDWVRLREPGVNLVATGWNR